MNKQEIEALKARLEIAEKTAEELATENADLKAQLAAVAKAKEATKTTTTKKAKVVLKPFAHADDIYQLKYPAFKFEGVRYEAEKIQAAPAKYSAILNKLIESSSSLIKKDA